MEQQSRDSPSQGAGKPQVWRIAICAAFSATFYGGCHVVCAPTQPAPRSPLGSLDAISVQATIPTLPRDKQVVLGARAVSASGKHANHHGNEYADAAIPKLSRFGFDASVGAISSMRIHSW